MLDNKFEYNQMAAVEQKHWWYKVLHQRVYSEISKLLPEKKSLILDAGCGTGGLLQFFIGNGYTNVQGFDISDFAIDICLEKKLNVHKRSLLKLSDFCIDTKFDAIISNDTFYFLSESEQLNTTNQFYRLLNKKGIVILNLPSLKAFRGTHDISVGINFRFNKNNISKMFDKTKFEILELYYWPFLLSPVIGIVRLIQRIKLRLNPSAKIVSDIALPSPLINNILYKITTFENKKYFSKPFGSSLFVVAQAKK